MPSCSRPPAATRCCSPSCTAPARDSPTPLGIRAAVGAEVRRSRRRRRDRLVEAGAVLGDPFVVDVAADTAGLPPAAWPGALDELVGAGLLVAAGLPTRVPLPAPGGAHRRPRGDVRGHPAGRCTPEPPRPWPARMPPRWPRPATWRTPPSPATWPPRRPCVPQPPRCVAGRPRSRPTGCWSPSGSLPHARSATFGELARVLVQSGRLDEALAVAEEGLAFGDGPAHDRLEVSLVAASVERQLGRHDSARRRLTRLAGSPGASPCRPSCWRR